MYKKIRQNYPMFFVLSVSSMLLVILLLNGFRAYSNFEGYHQEIGKNEVRGAVNNIRLLIEDYRKSLTLFARDNQNLLQDIQIREDKSIVFDELVTLLDDHFPARQAFALADQNGFVIVDDKGGAITRQCLSDIKTFADGTANTHSHPNLSGVINGNGGVDVQVHADQRNGHIDIIVPWGTISGKKGVFLINFSPDIIVQALNANQVLGHEIIISRADDPNLIEIVASVENQSQIHAPIRKAKQYLNDSEQQRINEAVKIPGTKWLLMDIFDQDLLTIQRDNIFSQSTFSFILFCFLSGILLYIAKKEEWRRQQLELELKNTNESLEETITTRTHDLVEVNTELKRENNERKIAEQKLKHIARFDTLTELPNRLLLNERLQQAYISAKRHKRRYALFFLDIDHFKHINDSYGHSFGDKLLVIIAQRLALSVRKEDMLARFGGDEFAILINDIRGQSNLIHIAEKIISTVIQPIVIDHQELYVTISIGIAIYPEDGDTIEKIVSNADAAMYRSKLDGRNSFAFFTRDMAEKLKRRHILSNSLQQALSRNEFRVYYQAKIDLFSNEVVGAEALLRWTHPTLGPINPDEFIPILEENGLIGSIGNWIIDQVCQFLKNRILTHQRDIPIAINLSANQFRDPSLAANISAIIENHKVPASFIEFEVTESLLIQNIESTQTVLNQFQDMGIKITIDDFGTGYASINYLRLFPVNSVKIDATFLKNIIDNKEDAAIVRAIVTMAHSLKLTCIAEGVETLDQLKILKSHHCDCAQGYYFSEALSKEAFNSWVGRNLIEA